MEFMHFTLHLFEVYRSGSASVTIVYNVFIRPSPNPLATLPIVIPCQNPPNLQLTTSSTCLWIYISRYCISSNPRVCRIYGLHLSLNTYFQHPPTLWPILINTWSDFIAEYINGVFLNPSNS